ncbi:hypothetical protein GCM10011320_35760 [Neoroseomonas lacus]|uniref:Uncharacterized protein n=1 Tax=Neoroseomonas lacus TaxID=287609 RepID=A0A917KS82_9PROT|nr:hypothetical protein GCM10011320_35760 [Neoroseomonas lacus]
MELGKALVGLISKANGWHAAGLTVTVGVLLVMHVSGTWAPTGDALALAYAAATAAGLALGSVFNWIATDGIAAARRWRKRRADTKALLAHLGLIEPAEKAILGAYLRTGLQRHPVAMADPRITALVAHGLLVPQDGTYHRVPDAVWEALKLRAADFPAGSIPPPTGREWMLR